MTDEENKCSIYTRCADIEKILQSRKPDSKVTQEIIGKALLTPELSHLLEKQHLVFFRQLATPLHETLRVIELAEQLQIELCILEFFDDKFVSTGNPYKKGLGKLPVYTHTAHNGEDIYVNHTVVDFNNFVGQPIRKVMTTKGEPLIDFHHELFTYVTNRDVHTISIDGSKWFTQFKGGAAEYYEAFLSLFVYNNVLAEIFSLEGQEEDLTKNIVIPAFQKVIERYGKKPLILNYQPDSEQTRKYWDCYPNKVNDFLSKKGYY